MIAFFSRTGTFRAVMAAALVTTAVGLTGCTQETRDEAGQAVDETGDVVREAGEDVGAAVATVGDIAGDAAAASATAMDDAVDRAQPALERARVSLGRIDERMAAGADYAQAEAADDVAALRADLAKAYDGAEAGAAEAWADADRSLDEAEIALRAGSAGAMENLIEVLERVRLDLLHDNERPG